MDYMPNMYVPYGAPAQGMNANPQFMPQSTAGQGMQKGQMKEFCKQYHHHYIMMEADDGQIYEGIIDGMDDDNVDMLVPIGDMDREDMRQYPYGGYPYSPYGYPYGYYNPYVYGYPRRFRRFARRRFPFSGLRAFFFPIFI